MLKDIIEEIREERKGAWIYNDKSEIRDDVFVGDTLDILTYFLENGWEVDCPYEDVMMGYNTYNWSPSISNDITWCFRDEIMFARVHISGDVRVNYSNLFALNIGSLEQLYDALPYLSKEIDSTHIATFNIFEEGFEVYNTETDESFRCYECELSNLLEEIKEKENK